ncbi:MAG: glycosyltransferase family 4 protein [Planctomycetota bacterium]
MTQPAIGDQLKRVAVIGTYPPRLCGIGTFTYDLCEAIAGGFPDIHCFTLPVNDTETGYAYPPRARFEIAENELASYRSAADFLNINNVDLVCLQHEYGIYGGMAGSHILTLLRELRMPVVTTLHTILREPDPHQHRVMKELAQLSDRVVTMARTGADFLRNIYGVPEDKIDFIPHGIPDLPFVDPNFYKDHLGVEGKMVLLTFGLLSPNKGIEVVIDALPEILKSHPQVVYIILGATHPHVKRREGEAYRLSLEQRAEDLGVNRNVIFHNRFVSLEELVEFIGMADIYITPYLNPAQMVSGTLAYTVGAGKAVVSAPYWYAEEILQEGRGRLVPFRDSAAVAAAVKDLLENEAERHAMRKRAYLFGREMIWSKVSHGYIDSFRKARGERARRPRAASAVKTLDKRPRELPPLNLDHLRRMTDHTGILQHAIYIVPNYSHGYATDDNARALILTILLESIEEDPFPRTRELASRYMAFLWHAFHPETGRFRNFMSYERHWLDGGTEDGHGRALWGLGTVAGRSADAQLRDPASRLFTQGLPATLTFSSPRAWAFTLIGIHEYLKQFSGDKTVQNAREALSSNLLRLYRANSSPDWLWFEDSLAYCNAKLPHALFLSGQGMSQSDMVQTGLSSLEWLMKVQRAEGGHFVPIGSNGFYRKGGERARFDQQPVEAHATLSACMEAQRLTGKSQWAKEAMRVFEWFLGRNDLRLPVYDSTTGGCRDGLHPDRLNQNEGAESTLAFLLSLLEMRLAQEVIPSGGEK